MEQSILRSVKNKLDLEPDYTEFDSAVIDHINSTFSVLYQIGIGPAEGFMIEDDKAVWGDLISGVLGENMVRTYTYLKVRMLFDPPTTSYHISAMEKQISEYEYRLNMEREHLLWRDPNPDSDRPYLPSQPVDYDFDGGEIRED